MKNDTFHVEFNLAVLCLLYERVLQGDRSPGFMLWGVHKIYGLCKEFLRIKNNSKEVLYCVSLIKIPHFLHKSVAENSFL